jgi:nucleoside-diphosphate-sugar epimerase
MLKFLLFGGCGFVGTNLTERIVKNGHKAVVIDNLTYTQKPNLEFLSRLGSVEIIEGDVRNEGFVNEMVGSGVDGVFHLASVVGIKNYLKDPLSLIDIGVIGTRHIAKACAERGVRMLFTSTSEVLGRNTDVPWREDADRVYGASTVDRWAYGSSKGVAEHFVNAMNRHHGLRATIIRFFNIYGPFQRPYFVASKTLFHCLRGEAPLRYDSGRQTRCFTYIDDAISAVVLLMESELAVGNTYHIGSRFEMSVDQIIDLTREVCGSSVDAMTFDTRRQYGALYEDLDRRVPDVSKIHADIGWQANTDPRTGMTKFRDWARRNDWWLQLDV